MTTVYQPAEDSLMMEDALLSAISGLRSTVNREPLTVLDMGTGSGILAIAAAKKGCRVTAADINPEAVEAARRNAEAEGVEVKVVRSDLFENVEGRYDLIVFNPPYVRTEEGEQRDMESIAWHGGKTGLETVNRFLSAVSGFLEPGGRMLLLVSGLGDKPPKFEGFRSRVLKKRSFFFERLFVLELRFK